VDAIISRALKVVDCRLYLSWIRTIKFVISLFRIMIVLFNVAVAAEEYDEFPHQTSTRVRLELAMSGVSRKVWLVLFSGAGLEQTSVVDSLTHFDYLHTTTQLLVIRYIQGGLAGLLEQLALV